MRAVVAHDKRLEFAANHPDPAPSAGECLVRVRLAGICATDLHILDGYMNFAGVLGHEMIGTVEGGPAEWRGKRVVCEINCVCRKCDLCQAGLANHCRNRTVMGIQGRDGCFADLVAVPVYNLHHVPDSIPDEEAVFVEPLAAAYQAIAQCPMDASTKVTVVGPGRLGLLVAQVIAETGSRLTVVGRNRMKLEMCEKKGIQGVHVDDLVPKHDHDVVVECTGSPEGLDIAASLVRPRGTIVLKSTYAGGGSPNLAPIVINEVTILGSRCGPFPEAINALARQAVDVRSMISRIFSLEEAPTAFEMARSHDVLKLLLRP